MIKKISLFSKFMTLQPGKQTITIHALLNISRSKGNQTEEFGHLLEYSLKKSYTKCCGETIPGPLSKKLKLSISNILCSLLCQVECYRNISGIGLPV